MTEGEWEELLSVVRMEEDKPQTIEDRVGLLEDKASIHDLIMEYAFYSDARVREPVFDRYSEDITRILSGTLTEEVHGKESLREIVERPQYPRVSGAPSPPLDLLKSLDVMHFVTNVVIRVAADRKKAWAVGRVMMVAARTIDGQRERGVHESSYAFEFRNEAGRWNFTRQVVISGQGNNPLYGGHSASGTQAKVATTAG
jgi:hypothetical protein